MTNRIRNTLISLSLIAAAGTFSGLSNAGDAAHGETYTVACAACHGADGNSAVANFPKLAGLGEKYILQQLRAIKSGEREVPEMAGQLDALDDEDLADIATYYAGKTMQLSGSKEQTVQLNSGLKVDGLALGAKVYRAGNAESGVPACSGCHSPRGLGNAPAGYPRLGGQHADYIVKQLKDFRAGNRISDGDAMPMRGVAQHMSDAEIEAVANFISGLN